jgi:alcohol dehydrogenase
MNSSSLTQRSLLLTQSRKLEWVDEKLPALEPHQILVRTIAGAISMGTEIPLYTGTHPSGSSPRTPMMTGYESLAEVIEVGESCNTHEIGDRIISFYGHRTYAIVDDHKAIPVPENISNKLALLSILFCDVSEGLSKLKLQSSDQILITGAGTVGLLTLFALMIRGFEKVESSEPIEKRISLAIQLGAHHANIPAAFQDREIKYDIGIECSSKNDAFRLLQQKLKHSGQICVLSDGNLEPLALSPEFHRKQLFIVGSSDSNDYPGFSDYFFQHANSARHTLESMFDHSSKARDLPKVIEAIANAEIQPIKVFVEY